MRVRVCAGACDGAHGSGRAGRGQQRRYSQSPQRNNKLAPRRQPAHKRRTAISHLERRVLQRDLGEQGRRHTKEREALRRVRLGGRRRGMREARTGGMSVGARWLVPGHST